MMNLDKYINLLTEEIVGNLATVYHRGSKDKLNRLLNKTYVNQSHIDFNNYDKALYTTTDMKSQLNQGNHQFNNMKEVYGDYIIKLVFKGVSNCWFCDYDEYRKFNNCTIDNWKEQQFKKFNISYDEDQKKLLAGYNEKHTENHTKISRYFEKRGFLGKRVKGIQYNGKGDGSCLLIYDWSTAVPIAVSNDEGKTWEKVDKSKTSFSRSNFNKNDYIDTTSKSSTKINFNKFIDKNGNINCSYIDLFSLQGAPKTVSGTFECGSNELTSLQGAPKIVGGNFNCSANNITSLQGAPEKVGGNFKCSANKITSLQGAPKIVGGNFECADNEFSKEELLKYLKTAKIEGYLFTDYGFYNNQEEAIKKLSGLNEEIFNY